MNKTIDSYITLLNDSSRNCSIRYFPEFLTKPEANDMYAYLMNFCEFEAEKVYMFDKYIEVKRKSCAFGTNGLIYEYSGVTRKAVPWSSEILALKTKVEEHTLSEYNFVLCNLYPDGQAGLGWHSDLENSIVKGSTISSLSFGAERDFDVRLGCSGSYLIRQQLQHGSLLRMGENTQMYYQHQIPKRTKCLTPRINLTFRLLKS
jgi:alkylated DNA repair dioxygenase AlkB